MTLGKIFARWLVRRVARNPWHRFKTGLPEGAFGARERTAVCALRFSSQVRVSSVPEVCDWLAGCAKVDAIDSRFAEANLGVLAQALENDRAGNCKAHAAWAFGKLAGLGLNPLLVIGRLCSPTGVPDYHAWVMFERNGETVVLEAMTADAAQMIKRFEEIRSDYVPRFAGDAEGRTYVFPDQLHAQLES